MNTSHNLRRWRSVDAVRGFVLVIMALDHLRDFVGNAHYDATDLAQTHIPVFLSRWITHLCAPTFFFLAGLSTYLSISSGRRNARSAARFLVIRGAALVVVEQTLLKCFGWYFHFDYHFMNAGVLYGLGLSMIILAAFTRLPASVSFVVGLCIILCESTITSWNPGGSLGTLVSLATQSRDFEPVSGYHFFVSYPPIPWFGAMALGYGVGSLSYQTTHVRQGRLVALGLIFLSMFAALRLCQVGDPSPWVSTFGGIWTLLSFVNVSKYPPSTEFLLLMLGFALLLVAAFQRWPRRVEVLEVYGRVPLFFYLAHIPLIHLIAVVYSEVHYGAFGWLTKGPEIFWDTALPDSPPGYGLALPLVWAVWAGFAVMMYALCRWYAAKRSPLRLYDVRSGTSNAEAD